MNMNSDNLYWNVLRLESVLIKHRDYYQIDCAISNSPLSVNTLRPRQNGGHFADDHFGAFSWMKMYWFGLKFRWSLFSRVRLIIFHHSFRKWLAADQVTSHYQNQWWLFCWCIYVPLGLNEINTINQFWYRAMYWQLKMMNHQIACYVDPNSPLILMAELSS